MDDLFSAAAASRLKAQAPLAARLRPRSLDEIVGQQHLVGPGRPLRTLVEQDKLTSAIFWGPPGTGKTTLAEVVALSTHRAFERLSAVTAGVKPRPPPRYATRYPPVATGVGPGLSSARLPGGGGGSWPASRVARCSQVGVSSGLNRRVSGRGGAGSAAARRDGFAPVPPVRTGQAYRPPSPGEARSDPTGEP